MYHNNNNDIKDLIEELKEDYEAGYLSENDYKKAVRHLKKSVKKKHYKKQEEDIE